MTTVLITGAAGNIGSKLRRAFEPLGWNLRLLDISAEDKAVIPADITQYHMEWAKHFAGVDAVIHLAGNGWAWAPQSQILRPNWEGTRNVFRAAHEGRVKRVIFASSNWVMAGYRGSKILRTPCLDPWPINHYGHSKRFGELLGEAYVHAGSFSFIAFRIGWCQAKHDNRPGAHMGSVEEQFKWLSTEDMVRAMIAAVQSPMTGTAVVNLMSRNFGMPWSLDETEALLGNVIQDGALPTINDAVRAEHRKEAMQYRRAKQKFDAFAPV